MKKNYILEAIFVLNSGFALAGDESASLLATEGKEKTHKTMILCETPLVEDEKSQHAVFYVDGNGAGKVLFDVVGRDHAEIDVGRVKIFDCTNGVCVFKLDPTGYTKAVLGADRKSAILTNGRNFQYRDVPCTQVE